MDNVEEICRICLTGSAGDIDSLMIDIFPREAEEFKQEEFAMLEAFRDICGLEVQESDLLPKQLCSICYSKLEQAFSLRQQAQKSFETLSNVVTKAAGNGQFDEEQQQQENDDGNEDLLYEVEYLEDQESVELESDVKVEPTELQAEIICCGCDDTFQTENELRWHAGRRHRPKVPVAGVSAGRKQCNICFEVFDRAEFVRHREGKNNVQPLNACNFCGCKFVSRSGLANHQLKFHEDNRYRCCGCDFSTLRHTELKSHSKKHKTEFIKNDRVTRDKKYYSCKVCFAELETLVQKRHHERFPYRKLKPNQTGQTDEVTVSVLRCCGCPKIFPSQPELRTHQQEVHLPQRPKKPDALATMVECGGCYRQFRNKGYLNRHLRQAAEKKIFACGKCSVTRRTLKELIEHEATHTGGGAFICCGCRKGFASKQELEQHSQEVHARRPKVYYNDEESTVRPFECGVCFRRYKSARDLRGHQRFVYYEKVHVCELCGKGFAQENSLTMHLATHKSHPEFPCPICGKKYKHESNVRTCIGRHERPKSHRCKICNVTFPAASNLYSHMVSHSEDRRYRCDECGQSYKRIFHLRKHQNTHTSVRNFACRHCPSRFSTTTELYKHEIRHTGQYPYQCGVCAKQLTTRQLFIKHAESHVTEAEKVHRCELCPARFSQDHFLSNHVKYTHRLEPQDKAWNEKFNRQAPPNRMKGGVRIAGVLLGGGSGIAEREQKEEQTCALLIDEQMEGMEEIAVELEIRDE